MATRYSTHASSLGDKEGTVGVEGGIQNSFVYICPTVYMFVCMCLACAYACV